MALERGDTGVIGSRVTSIGFGRNGSDVHDWGNLVRFAKWGEQPFICA